VCARARMCVCVCGRAGGRAGGRARVCVFLCTLYNVCVCRANTSAHVHTTVRYTQTAAHTRPRDIQKYTHICIVSVHVGSQSMHDMSAQETWEEFQRNETCFMSLSHSFHAYSHTLISCILSRTHFMNTLNTHSTHTLTQSLHAYSIRARNMKWRDPGEIETNKFSNVSRMRQN